MVRVLIVDDEQGMRDFLSIMLKKEGYGVAQAESAERAAELSARGDFDLALLRPTHSPDATFLEDAQELDLHSRAGVPDLIEEDRPALARLEQSLLGRHGTCEGSACVPEQLALEQLARHGTAVDRHEGAILSEAARVDRAGEQLLSGSRFPLKVSKKWQPPRLP